MSQGAEYNGNGWQKFFLAATITILTLLSISMIGTLVGILAWDFVSINDLQQRVSRLEAQR